MSLTNKEILEKIENKALQEIFKSNGDIKKIVKIKPINIQGNV